MSTMFRIVSTIAKGMIKVRLGKPLIGGERFILASLYSKIDHVATLLIPSNVHPKLIDQDYDFVRLNSDVESNLELFEKLQACFPNVDAAMPASWLGLAGFFVLNS